MLHLMRDKIAFHHWSVRYNSTSFADSTPDQHPRLVEFSLKHIFLLFQVNVLCRGAYILTIDFVFLINNIDTLKIKSRSYRK